MKCRLDGLETEELFSLGDMYVSDFIPMDAKSEDYQSKVPLKLVRGQTGLVQLADTADFDKMYKRYWYHSGTNGTMCKELKSIVDSVVNNYKLNPGDIWLDIGCNDGTLLSYVPSEVCKVGIDPAVNNCAKAKQQGIEVVNDYFSASAYPYEQKAKVITSIAMFYDLPDPRQFCRDIHTVLDNDGVWIIQMSYLPLMLDQVAFDNICHEHLEYYDLKTLRELLHSEGFTIFDAQLNDVNGGSFRLYIKKAGQSNRFGTLPYQMVARTRVEALYAYEEYERNIEEEIEHFIETVSHLKIRTVKFIEDEVAKGKTVWAYGASTKGNTLLQYFGLDKTLIKGIAERQEQKWGLKTIGTEIPIYSEEYVRSQNPDYMLVLPWHFIQEFKVREKEFLDRGGKFIVPCPNFEVIGK